MSQLKSTHRLWKKESWREIKRQKNWQKEIEINRKKRLAGRQTSERNDKIKDRETL